MVRQRHGCAVSVPHVRLQWRWNDATGEPDAGDPKASDSDGKGVWISDGDRIKGKWVEVIADRATHKFTGRAEISFDITVNGNTFAGTVTARSYDANDILTDGPTAPGRFEGQRITYP
jgi:hypothetical protein